MATWLLARPVYEFTGDDDTNNATALVALDNTPADFLTATDVSITEKTTSVGAPLWSDDSLGLDVRIMSGATVLAAADSGGTYESVIALDPDWAVNKTFPAITFTWVNTTATKTQWDAAQIQYRQLYLKNKGGDGTHLIVFGGADLITVTYDGEDGLTADDLQSFSQVSQPAVAELSELYLRPDLDDTVGSWATHTGATTNLYQQIDEVVASDADYVRSDTNPTDSAVKFRLSNSVPKPVAASAQWVEYRFRKEDLVVGTRQCDLTVRLIEGASTVRATWTHTNIATGWTDASQALTGPQKSSITDYDDLYLEFEADAP